jgi:hypothetical protein
MRTRWSRFFGTLVTRFACFDVSNEGAVPALTKKEMWFAEDFGAVAYGHEIRRSSSIERGRHKRPELQSSTLRRWCAHSAQGGSLLGRKELDFPCKQIVLSQDKEALVMTLDVMSA